MARARLVDLGRTYEGITPFTRVRNMGSLLNSLVGGGRTTVSQLLPVDLLDTLPAQPIQSKPEVKHQLPIRQILHPGLVDKLFGTFNFFRPTNQTGQNPGS